MLSQFVNDMRCKFYTIPMIVTVLRRIVHRRDGSNPSTGFGRKRCAPTGQYRRFVSLGLVLLVILLTLPPSLAYGQDSTNADVAAYQLGVIAETKPGSEITYSITVTNYGTSTVKSFYIVDGWTVNEQGISAFAQPVPDPDFGDFEVAGTWEQERKDQTVFAWLLNGELLPGDTIHFAWTIQVAPNYVGGLVNWARILTNGKPDGQWQPRQNTAAGDLPAVTNADDPENANNRTPDGVTVVTDSPTGKGVDMALYQTGLVNQIEQGTPLKSTWLVSNFGPQTINQFYVMAAWSVGANGNSLLVQPIQEPDFGNFKVLGSWQQMRQDEELWLWLLEGELKAGESVSFDWERVIVPDYQGDMINWSRVIAQQVPDGEWIARTGIANTSGQPQSLKNEADANPENDRSIDGLSTIVEK